MPVQRTKLPTHRPLIRILWEQTALALFARREGLDLLHGLAYAVPLLHTCRTVVTVHDLSFLREPSWYRWNRATYYRYAAQQSVRQAHRLIADSYATHELCLAIDQSVAAGGGSVRLPLPS